MLSRLCICLCICGLDRFRGVRAAAEPVATAGGRVAWGSRARSRGMVGLSPPRRGRWTAPKRHLPSPGWAHPANETKGRSPRGSRSELRCCHHGVARLFPTADLLPRSPRESHVWSSREWGRPRIGRDEIWQALLARRQRAVEGAGGLTLLEGGGGIGKSTFLALFAQDSIATGSAWSTRRPRGWMIPRRSASSATCSRRSPPRRSLLGRVPGRRRASPPS